MSERLTEKGVARLGAVPVLGLVPGLMLGLALGLIVRSSAPRSTRATQHLQVHLKSRGHPAGRQRLAQLLGLRVPYYPVGLRDRFRSRHAYARHTSTGPTAGLVSQPGAPPFVPHRQQATQRSAAPYRHDPGLLGTPRLAP